MNLLILFIINLIIIGFIFYYKKPSNFPNLEKITAIMASIIEWVIIGIGSLL
jgi:hypothetical protein